jgi:malonyl-CoA O-methyltransferase
MKIRDAYDLWAATYSADHNLTRDLDAIVTAQALKQRRYETILEIGCGAGKNTGLLAQIGKTVHAVDFSRGMMAKARTAVSAKNVRFTEADLTQMWPVKSGAVDLIVCTLVLEHIADLNFIFAEAARALRDKGTFYVSELHPCQQYQGKQANFRREGETVAIEAFTHHVSDFLDAARGEGFALGELGEWRHERDGQQPPRLITFTFHRGEGT